LSHHVCHITSLHPRFDNRIFHKQCKSLAQNGYKVTLLVADGKGNDLVSDISILDVGHVKSRIKRMFVNSFYLFKAALKLNADIYQFHDPDLLFLALALKINKKKVLFDSHEDVGTDLLHKQYIKAPFNLFLSKAYRLIEKFVCTRIDGVIAATSFIEKKFQSISPNTITICNYPILSDFDKNYNWENKCDEVCYVGSISTSRGLNEVVKSFKFISTNVRLNLVGKYAYSKIESDLQNLSEFKYVNEFGLLDNNGVKDVYSRSIAGIVTLHPIPTFIDSLPVKMFEYMAAGIPFIASDFPYWRSLVKGYPCCLFVNPMEPKEIANAIDFFIRNKDKAKEMGEIGRFLVFEKFSWQSESIKFLDFYNSILNN
jgi:glycosyltransferase involved in cell wall biosynthesis